MPLTEFATPNNVSNYLQENEVALNTKAMQQALAKEEELSYMAPSGRYWEMLAELDPEHCEVWMICGCKLYLIRKTLLKDTASRFAQR